VKTLEENIKMSLEYYPRFVNDNDPELAIAKALFLSTRPNSHGFHLSNEVLRKYAPTILGKFLVGNLNLFGTDVMSHEKKPDIFGYIPTTQEVEFVEADDGYLDAYVNIVVSKIYATEVYNLFLDDNFRNVSVEMRIMYTDEESKDVAEFNVAGLTVLGKLVNPSVPRAHMEMVRFSADNAEMYYKSQMKCSSEKQETEVLRKLSAIYNKLNLKEETENKEEAEEKMAKLEEEKKNVVMEQPTEEAPKEDEKKLAEDADKKEEEKEEVKDEKASDNSDSDKKDDEKKEEEEKASDDSDEKEEDKKEDDDKLSEAKAQCADLEAKCAELEAELSKLEKFKADTEEKEKMAIVNQTLAQVKESMDSDTYAKFEEKAKEQTLDTVNAWRNEVLANVATVLMSAKKDESHLRMGIEEDSKTPTSLWDRM
jgi:hypothetical protein